jgi:SP family general alpha glucoside:H+ symporter-like MFS transporter
MATNKKDHLPEGAPARDAEVQPARLAPAADDFAHGQSDPSKTHHNIIESARAAAAKEQSMTLWQGLKLYPKAVGWSLLISTCIAMEGYDISLVNNFCESKPILVLLASRSSNVANRSIDAFPQFTQKYGEYQPKSGTYEVTAPWQAGLSNVRLSLPLSLPPSAKAQDTSPRHFERCELTDNSRC